MIMKNNNIGSYLIRLSISVLIAFLLVAGGTWAYWQWSSTGNKAVVFNTVKGFEEYVKYDPGESHFIGDFGYTSKFCESPSTTITVQKTRADIEFNMTIKMDINEMGDSISSGNVLVVITRSDNNISCFNGMTGIDKSSSVVDAFNIREVKDLSTVDLTNSLPISTVETKYTIWIWMRDDSDIVSGDTLDVNIWSQIDVGDVATGEAYAIIYENSSELVF